MVFSLLAAWAEASGSLRCRRGRIWATSGTRTETGRRAVCARPRHLAAQRGRGRGGHLSRAGKSHFPPLFLLLASHPPLSSSIVGSENQSESSEVEWNKFVFVLRSCLEERPLLSSSASSCVLQGDPLVPPVIRRPPVQPVQTGSCVSVTRVNSPYRTNGLGSCAEAGPSPVPGQCRLRQASGSGLRR